MTRKKHKYIDTIWSVRTYDVWGNAKDGYEVNDVYSHHRAYPMRLTVEVNNQGTPQEFESAYPSDKQLREALGIKPRVRLDIDGDDINIYVRHQSTDYPFGELNCESHESLSPIREKVKKEA